MKLLKLAMICLAVSSCAVHHKQEVAVAATAPKKDTSAIAEPKPYNEIITDKAISARGLFTIHQVGVRFYFEIRDSLLNRDILTVNRIEKAPAEGRFYDWGMAGDLIGWNIIHFTREQKNKLFIRRVSFYNRSADSSENGMYYNVLKSNVQPIVASFDIKTITKDSTAYVIDVTDYLNAENDIFFFDGGLRKMLGTYLLSTYQPTRSFIRSIKPFSGNVEIHSVKTYSKDDNSYQTHTFELNSSIVLLPEQKMRPRYFDTRVGYFSYGYRNFDDPQGANPDYIITRWRLEPREEDIARYLKGELVEPKKQIVFYVDPTTPKKWVPYMIRGVNAWQKAFEKAGFKNAIVCKPAPVNDSSWSIDDAAHSVIVYKPSQVQNASGPHIGDPRTGEILESHINIHEDVVKLLRKWYFVQASPSDPNARKIVYDDSLMGRLLEYVCTHEVGHTLGLTHNFGASSAVAVEKLRDKDWVEANGICPSIMDYARFNYVAQPRDHIGQKGLMARIGAYDEWAIEWGYRWYPDQKPETEEKQFMSRWIIERTGQDKRLWFGSGPFDPRCQSQDIGDDAVKAAAYGIANLKLVNDHLLEWTKYPENDLDITGSMGNEILTQYARYISQVTSIIGADYYNQRTSLQPGVSWQFVEKSRQQSAVRFLQEQLFTTPTWMINRDIQSNLGSLGYLLATYLQNEVLKVLLSAETFRNLSAYQIYYPERAYTPEELINELEAGIWKELDDHSPIDLARRNLQKVYTDQLIALIDKKAYDGPFDYLFKFSDLPSLAEAHIRSIINRIDRSLKYYKDYSTISHLKYTRDNLKKAIAPGAQINSEPESGSRKSALHSLNITGNCWEDNIGLLPAFFFKQIPKPGF